MHNLLKNAGFLDYFVIGGTRPKTVEEMRQGFARVIFCHPTRHYANVIPAPASFSFIRRTCVPLQKIRAQRGQRVKVSFVR
jgi:hypothetical protein